jgi:hypothetical protein
MIRGRFEDSNVSLRSVLQMLELRRGEIDLLCVVV